MAEPLTLAEAKQHLRIAHSSENAYLESLLAAARLDIEGESWRALVRRQRTLTLNRFPCGDDPIYLPLPPLVSVDEIAYFDLSGVARTLTGYRVDTSHEPGLVVPAFNGQWPDTYDDPAAVTITLTCGYAAGAVPENIKHCVRLKLSELYEGRVPSPAEKRTTLDRLLDKIRFRDTRILPFILGEPPDVHVAM